MTSCVEAQPGKAKTAASADSFLIEWTPKITCPFSRLSRKTASLMEKSTIKA
jgi:hypothetical protein